VSHTEQEDQYPQHSEVCRHEASGEEDLLDQSSRCGILAISEAAFEGVDCGIVVGVEGPAEDLAEELGWEEGVHAVDW
jgi:hypothetical protein